MPLHDVRNGLFMSLSGRVGSRSLSCAACSFRDATLISRSSGSVLLIAEVVEKAV